MGTITLLVTLPGMLLGPQVLPVPIEPALPNLSQPQPLPRALDVTDSPFIPFSSHFGLGHFHENPSLFLGQNPAGFVISQLP